MQNRRRRFDLSGLSSVPVPEDDGFDVVFDELLSSVTPRAKKIGFCHYHPNEAAVSSCPRCGKRLCKGCHDAYSISDGMYEGETLCYDCVQQAVNDFVVRQKKEFKKAKIGLVLTVTGIVLGFIAGWTEGYYQDGIPGHIVQGFLWGVFWAAIGGVFLSAAREFIAKLKDAVEIFFSGSFSARTLLQLIFHILRLVLECFRETATNLFSYIRCLRESPNMIRKAEEALRLIDDYMEYASIRAQNEGVDIETLLSQNSQLDDNIVAQMARTQSDEEIQRGISNRLSEVNDYGLIIIDRAAA